LTAFWGALAIVVGPWILRNGIRLGTWRLSTAFEENLARVSAVATEAKLMDLRLEPWSESWEHLYQRRVKVVTGDADGVLSATGGVGCAQLRYQQTLMADASRRIVTGHLWAYLDAHLQGVLRAVLDPGHRVWYYVLTGQDWSSTGVVPSIIQRMAWSLRRAAVGDALRAFWTQRLRDIPALAAALWWALTLQRALVIFLVLRGLWRLRTNWVVGALLAGVVLYHVLLPGPIAYDRFYVPIVPVVCVCVCVPWRSAWAT
jgi:hypothetical protein